MEISPLFELDHLHMHQRIVFSMTVYLCMPSCVLRALFVFYCRSSLTSQDRLASVALTFGGGWVLPCRCPLPICPSTSITRRSLTPGAITAISSFLELQDCLESYTSMLKVHWQNGALFTYLGHLNACLMISFSVGCSSSIHTCVLDDRESCTEWQCNTEL